jgi:FkbM family methyltransferase
MSASRVLALLENIDPFPSKAFRKNIRQPGQKTNPMGFAMGKVWKLDEGIYESRFNEKFADLWKALKALAKEYDPRFPWTSVQVNKNQQCALHRDRNNKGPSIMIGLGDYTGGELVVVDEVTGKEHVHDARNRFVRFDGNHAHYTKPFKGTRYTLVYFTMNGNRSHAVADTDYKQVKTNDGLVISYRDGTSDIKAIREACGNLVGESKKTSSYERTRSDPSFRIAPGDAWLDVGGQIGSFALRAAKNGATRVVTVEPEPDNLRLLKLNRKQNGFGIVVVPAACVAGKGSEGTVVLRKTPSTYKHTLVSGGTSVGTVRVKAVTLKELFERFPEISAVKMDVEGSEYDLLKSIDWKKDTRVDKLVFEYSFDHYPDMQRFYDLITFLRKHFTTVFHNNIQFDKTWDTKVTRGANGRLVWCVK